MKINLPTAPKPTGTVFAPHTVPPVHAPQLPPTGAAIGPPEPEQLTLVDGPIPSTPVEVAPVPPPPEPPLPETYEGFIELAKQVSKGPMTDKAHLWVRMAQAQSSYRIANALEELIDILQPEEVELENGDFEEAPSVLSGAIAEGILMAENERTRASMKGPKEPKKKM